ncbi:OmpA family protein [Flavobacterium sp.]|uniref:OmpA family protein n=1 Tax=Flavobacterium sp. TaxID=239 RepID=UPI00374DCD13
MKTHCILLFLFFSLVGNSQEKFEIFFNFNAAIPNEKSAKNFQKWISENSKAEITKIYGYCDSVDDKSYNKELSVKRINSVIKTLKENNFKLSKSIDLKPFGKDFERSINQNENRKVVIFYKIGLAKKTTDSNKEIPSPPFDYNSKVSNEKATLASKFATAKVGDLVKIENIYFYLDSDKIVEKSKPLLLELYSILVKNPKLKIEIQGHICCNTDPTDMKLSNKRALFIYAYLLEKEILFNRLSYNGFGSSKPIYKIPEKNEAERLANRRVEILIVEK